MFKNIAIYGASGAIGNALLKEFSLSNPSSVINAFTSSPQNSQFDNVRYHKIDYFDEQSIQESADIAKASGDIDLAIVATGILHNNDIMPEKSLSQLSFEKFDLLYKSNAVVPAIIAKHVAKNLSKNNISVFACLSARVGSISDNHLGGWYSYRASKAALNMIIKNTAIEIARANKNACIVGLHPGTVDSNLSKPFQSNVTGNKLFTPEYSSKKLSKVINELNPDKTGKCFAWDGQEIDA